MTKREMCCKTVSVLLIISTITFANHSVAEPQASSASIVPSTPSPFPTPTPWNPIYSRTPTTPRPSIIRSPPPPFPTPTPSSSIIPFPPPPFPTRSRWAPNVPTTPTTPSGPTEPYATTLGHRKPQSPPEKCFNWYNDIEPYTKCTPTCQGTIPIPFFACPFGLKCCLDLW